MKKLACFSCLLFCLLKQLVAQENINHVQQNFSASIFKTSEKINIDGVFDEATWKNAPIIAQDFWMKFPTNITKATEKTEIKLAYDNQFIYVAATMYDSVGKYLLTSLKRDQGLRNGDGLSVVLDPQNQKANGALFSITPFNTQAEDVFSSSNYDLTFSWDNTWFSQTKLHNGYWTAELAIPFNILRYDANKLTWGINFVRSIRRKNEFHSWTQIPIQFRGIDLGYLGELVFDKAPPKSKSNISINPYTLGQVSKDKNKPLQSKANTGFDAKVAVTPSLNLDLTVNPDFSQVDVDQQVTNLTRFNIFFPERRNFFLENNDLFSSYGIPPIRPFYSRRIGGKNGAAVPILFGARLSGNISKKTRIGLMNITTGKKGEISGDNFTAVSVNQRVLERSNINGYFFNRQDLNNTSTKIAASEKYSRNGGISLEFSDKKGNWNGWYGHHLSLKPGINNQNQYFNFGGEYQGKNINAVVDFDYIGQNYYVDMGFESIIENYDALRDTVVRLGSKFVFTNFKYTWYGKEKNKWNRIATELENFFQFTMDGKAYEYANIIGFEYGLKNTSNFNFKIEHNASFLRFPYKFVDDNAALPIAAKQYNYTRYTIKYNSDGRKDKSYGLALTAGKFYNANFVQANADLTLRKQPKYSFILRTQFNRLQFPEGYGTQNLFLVAPQFEYNFSNKLFWTTFFQLNTQSNNININSRLQYRYRPMSDLFIVYTDNYFTDPLLNNKNKALVVKLNYWLNL